MTQEESEYYIGVYDLTSEDEFDKQFFELIIEEAAAKPNLD
ncbi:12008_t:CDS:2 [Entrophospora sp. SA101]|nr:12008_t:CDS:2 [Entrophospora sp. SA101]CAJ0880203.1 17455_t:CDS:2 [Entrophospora sp. SA101]